MSEASARERIQVASLLSECRDDPLKFVELAFPWGSHPLLLGKEILGWQREVLLAIKNRDMKSALQIAVASGHGVGKSTLVAWVTLWAISTRANTKGVITANTENQLKNKTWSELAKWHRLSIVHNLFDISKLALFIKDKKRESSWRVDAIAWNETRPEAFAGLHNQGGRIIIIFDEASAIPDIIWEVAEGALTDKDADIIFLAFGNPTRNEGRFKECFTLRSHRYKKFKVDSRTVSLTNKEQIASWIEDYGIDSDFVKVRVLGEFPGQDNSTLISTDTLLKAVERQLDERNYKEMKVYIGLDVARFGDDMSVLAVRQGSKLISLKKFSSIDTMQLAYETAHTFDKLKRDGNYNVEAFIDSTGIGAGVYDRLFELGYNVQAVDFGSHAFEKDKFFNKRAELWHRMAEWLKHADIPNDKDLIKQASCVRYYFKGDKNELCLERKSEIKKRERLSPDIADALALTFASIKEPKATNFKLPRKLLR